MIERHVRLKDALRARHWQTYRTFCREYDRAAKQIDPQLAGTWPSRAQLHRWLAGDIKGLPYPDHCRVLEGMLPEWSAEQLFEPCGRGCPLETTDPAESFTAGIVRTISDRLADPDSPAKDWGTAGEDSRPRQGNPTLGAALASARSPEEIEVPLPELMTRKLLALGQVQRIPPDEVAQLSELVGNLVELSIDIDLTVSADGLTSVTYRHHLLNLMDTTISRFPREVWFQHSRGKLELHPLREGDRKVALQRVHNADNIAKFACQLSPSMGPGESARFGYTCSGGLFLEDYYWRQVILRYTRQFTLRVRHCGAKTLTNFTAIEELPDGTECLTPQSVTWDYEGDDVIMTLTRDHLQPNQSATLRWETT